MSEELEALNLIITRLNPSPDNVAKAMHEVKIVENALKRLEQLEEEKQSFDREIEKKLKDYEWLKSIVPIDAMFMWNLSSDDKIRLLKIMGVEL